jgi:perosamine synthetase
MIKRVVRGAARRMREPLLKVLFENLMEGGPPGRKPFGAEELRLVYDALKSQNLFGVDGTMVPRFEKEFAVTYGVPHAIASTSGTAAIHVALGALDLEPGDEIITAPITDLGTIIPILSQGAIPVFADIDATYNMDPADVERKITPYTRAIIAVHLFGNPCDLGAMKEIARRRGIALIEDCSQAHMARYKGELVGTIGDIGCFSFQQSKHMTTGDGGMTITSNRAYADRMRLFADKGYARKGWGTRAYLFHAPNYRMNELTGAVGLAQVRKVAGVVARRAALGKKMSSLLAGVPGITPAPLTPGAEHAFWLYPIRVDGVDPRRVADAMKEAGFFVLLGYTGKTIYLCSESLAAKKTYGRSEWPFHVRSGTKEYEYKEGLCPRAEELLTHLLCMPWDESWSEASVERAAAVLTKAVRDASSTAGSRAPAISQPSPLPPFEAAADAAPRVRVGIVGCGQMGRWHLDSYRADPRVELVAFCDTNLPNAERFAEEAGGKAYASVGEMVGATRLDAASICTVPSTHRAIALELLSAGVHVLCEKPLAVSAAEADEMARKAEQMKRFLIPAFKFRFHDEVREAKKLIEKGSLGRISSFRLMFGADFPVDGSWYADKRVAGGGVIMDNGPHAVDLIDYLFGPIADVSAQAGRSQELDVEDTAQLICRMSDGTVGTIDLSWSVGVPTKAYLEIYGDTGTALLDLEGLSFKFKTWSEWQRIANRASVAEEFGRQISHFVEAVVSGRCSVVGNAEGVRSQKILDAAYRSVNALRKTNVDAVLQPQ